MKVAWFRFVLGCGDGFIRVLIRALFGLFEGRAIFESGAKNGAAGET